MLNKTKQGAQYKVYKKTRIFAEQMQGVCVTAPVRVLLLVRKRRAVSGGEAGRVEYRCGVATSVACVRHKGNTEIDITM